MEDYTTNNVNFIGPQVDRVESPFTVSDRENQRQRKYSQNYRKYKPEEAKDHLESLSAAAEKTNEILEEDNAPLRFCIYEEDNSIYIDFVFLDTQGNIQNSVKKDITHVDYFSLMEQIEKTHGLVLNSFI